jgi:hypothetical protein
MSGFCGSLQPFFESTQIIFRIETGDILVPLSTAAAKIYLEEVRGVNVIFEKDFTVADLLVRLLLPGMAAPGRHARFGQKKDSYDVL